MEAGWVKVADASSRLEATMIRDRLDTEGIDAQILGTQDANPFSLYRGDVPQFLDIVVPLSQKDAAQTILESIEKPRRAKPPLFLRLYVALGVASFAFCIAVNFLTIPLAISFGAAVFLVLLFVSRPKS